MPKVSKKNNKEAIDEKNVGKEIHDLIKKLYPLCRSISGEGVRETLKIIKENIPISVTEVPTGTKVFDWKVPREWNIKDAYIKNEKGEKVVDFKKSNKFILSYSESYSQKAYYLASVADKIYLNKEGSIDFHGLAAEIMFFKGLMQKLDVDMQIIRHGKFKSAVEPFLLDKMSDPNREQTRLFIGSIWNHIVKGISDSRKISLTELKNIADSLLVQSAEDALKYKFVDELVYKDQVIDALRKKLALADNDDIDYITLSKYADVKIADSKIKFSKNRIAIVYAVGAIEGGKGNDQTIGSERISEAIRDARTDNAVKAIVLRVNSPGGDALASEVIWREVMLAKKAKPVVVSMGDYAASGGYYIACAADKIIANPNGDTAEIRRCRTAGGHWQPSTARAHRPGAPCFPPRTRPSPRYRRARCASPGTAGGRGTGRRSR